MPQKPDLVKREAWRRRLRDFERGNATITEFCRRSGVPVWSFYYWQQRLRAGTIAVACDRQRSGTATPTPRARSVHRARRAPTKPRLNFVPVQLTGGRWVVVHLCNGTRVMVPAQDRDAIGAVMAALVSDSRERRRCSDSEGGPC